MWLWPVVLKFSNIGVKIVKKKEEKVLHFEERPNIKNKDPGWLLK